jgi:hypothetical protein
MNNKRKMKKKKKKVFSFFPKLKGGVTAAGIRV